MRAGGGEKAPGNEGNGKENGKEANIEREMTLTLFFQLSQVLMSRIVAKRTITLRICLSV